MPITLKLLIFLRRLLILILSCLILRREGNMMLQDLRFVALYYVVYFTFTKIFSILLSSLLVHTFEEVTSIRHCLYGKCHKFSLIIQECIFLLICAYLNLLELILFQTYLCYSLYARFLSELI